MNVQTRRITRLAAVGLAAGALAAPAAGARPAPADTPSSPEPAPVVQSVDEGFDWGSAAIGAGSAGALILLVSAGGIGLRHRNDHIGLVR